MFCLFAWEGKDDILSVIQSMASTLRKLAKHDIMFINGHDTDCLVACRIAEAPLGFQREKIWLRSDGKVTLYEEGLEFAVETDSGLKRVILNVRPTVLDVRPVRIPWLRMTLKDNIDSVNKWYPKLNKDVEGIIKKGKTAFVQELEKFREEKMILTNRRDRRKL